MTPERPLPTSPPFVSFYTPTFRRPAHLSACLESVRTQTAVEDIEQIVVPDHVRYGVGPGLYGRMPWYQSALRGRYVHILCDDDRLADECVVERVRDFAERHDYPDVIVVRVEKGGLHLPFNPAAPPICGEVDLCCYLVRNDIWQRHVKDYGIRYEGDYDHAKALFEAGYRFAACDLLFVVGEALNGRPEA